MMKWALESELAQVRHIIDNIRRCVPDPHCRHRPMIDRILKDVPSEIRVVKICDRASWINLNSRSSRLGVSQCTCKTLHNKITLLRVERSPERPVHAGWTRGDIILILGI